MTNRTIFTLSTAVGKSAIAIIRVSGSKSLSIVKTLTGSMPDKRKAVLRELIYKNELIDKAIVICFGEYNSYTGEDMVEFHVHGSNAVIKNLTEILGTELKLSVANPGEFTRRALENGRMDLSQVEGVLDLIEAETKEQQKQSLKSIRGNVSVKTKEWRYQLVSALALVEIMIDFSDQDVPANTSNDVKDIISLLLKYFDSELQGYKSSELIRDGFDVTIIGKPNVGKSSLLNFLAGSERAIVSEEAGTTRDLIELGIDLKGYRVNFFDTAGIHESSNAIEQIGIERAKKKADESSIRLFLLGEHDNIEQFDVRIDPDDLIFNAKVDLSSRKSYPGISGKTGQGVDKMLDMILSIIENRVHYSSILSNERHRSIIQSTVVSLRSAQDELYKPNTEVEILAEFLRRAINQLDLLVGKINTEDVLEAVFSSFCIGK